MRDGDPVDVSASP